MQSSERQHSQHQPPASYPGHSSYNVAQSSHQAGPSFYHQQQYPNQPQQYITFQHSQPQFQSQHPSNMQQQQLYGNLAAGGQYFPQPHQGQLHHPPALHVNGYNSSENDSMSSSSRLSFFTNANQSMQASSLGASSPTTDLGDSMSPQPLHGMLPAAGMPTGPRSPSSGGKSWSRNQMNPGAPLTSASSPEDNQMFNINAVMGPSGALADVTAASSNSQNKRKSRSSNSKAAPGSPTSGKQEEQGDLPVFQCSLCPKVYTGHHSRSIWRRHLSDKHGIPLSDQPRRTRWDGDENRPKDDNERRQRTLESKRRWARKRRARDKAKLEAAGGGREALAGSDDESKGNAGSDDEASKSEFSPAVTGRSISPTPPKTGMHPPGFVPSVLIKQESSMSKSLPDEQKPAIASPARVGPGNGPSPMLATSTPMRAKVSLTMPAPNFTISKDKHPFALSSNQDDSSVSTPAPMRKISSWTTLPESAKRLGIGAPMGNDLFVTSTTSSDATPTIPVASTPSRWTSNIPGMGNSPMSVSRYLGGGGFQAGGSGVSSSPSAMFSLDHLKPSPRDRIGRNATPSSASRYGLSAFAESSPTRRTAVKRTPGARALQTPYDRERNRDLPPLTSSTPTREASSKELEMLWKL